VFVSIAGICVQKVDENFGQISRTQLCLAQQSAIVGIQVFASTVKESYLHGEKQL
jgi:hypothetical protein